MSPTGLAGGVDLDDGAALLAADTRGRLWAFARAGAQVRAVASAVAEGELSRLGGSSPRSVVLLSRGAAEREAAVLAGVLAGPQASVPVLTVDATPRWVGALDLVVVLCRDAGDLELAGSVARATARGAQVVLVGPVDGPVAAAGAGRAVLLESRVAVGEASPVPGFLAAVLAVLGVVGVLAPPDLAVVADVVDRELARDHPDRDSLASPAKAVVARDRGGPWVLAAAGPLAGALGQVAAGALLRHAGQVAAAVDLTDALLAASPAAADELLFHDTEIDGPDPVVGRRVLVLAVASERLHLQRRAAALGEVEVLAGAEPAASDGEEAVDVLAETVVLLARIETVAVLLALTR